MQHHCMMSTKLLLGMQSNRVDMDEEYVEVFEDDRGGRDKKGRPDKLRSYKDDSYRYAPVTCQIHASHCSGQGFLTLTGLQHSQHFLYAYLQLICPQPCCAVCSHLPHVPCHLAQVQSTSKWLPLVDID